MAFWERKDEEDLMDQSIGFDGNSWTTLVNMLTNLFGQFGNKWFSILLSFNEDELGRWL